MIKDTRVVKDAVYLIDDKTMSSRGYAQSGWDYDNRGMRSARGEEIRGTYLCSDETGDFDPYLSRRFVPIRTGKAGFFHSFRLRYGEAFYLRFLSDDKKNPSRLKFPQKTAFSASAARKFPLPSKTKPTISASNLTLTAKKPPFSSTMSITARSS